MTPSSQRYESFSGCTIPFKTMHATPCAKHAWRLFQAVLWLQDACKKLKGMADVLLLHMAGGR